MSYDTTVEVSDDSTITEVGVHGKYATEGVYANLWGEFDHQVGRLDLTVDEARNLGAALINAANDSAKFAAENPR